MNKIDRNHIFKIKSSIIDISLNSDVSNILENIYYNNVIPTATSDTLEIVKLIILR